VSQRGLTTRRALRRFALGSGPLKRTSDRLQHLARILLVLILLIGVAIALAVATAHYTSARTEAAAQAADRHRASAELLEDERAPSDGDGDGDGDIRDVLGAAAVWTDSSGVERRGVIPVPEGAQAGSTVSIWIDREGTRTTRPVSNGDVATESAGYALLTYIGISMVAFGAYRSFRKLLDRNRSRRWAAEWAKVEPVWTRTVP
jgi:hypothetical protein